MNGRVNSVSTVFFLFTIFLTTCTGVPATTVRPVEEKPVVVTVPVTYEQNPVKDIKIDSYKDVNGLLVFVGTGTVDNGLGELLSVTATSDSEKSVKDYLETAKFYFEIRDAFEIPTITNEYNKPYYASFQELQKDEKVERIQINLDLPAEIKKRYSKGNVLVIIDPSISQNQAHIYTFEDPVTSGAQANIFSSLGKVEGTLYLQDTAIPGQSQSIAANELKYVGGIGEGKYDLVIRGIDGLNQYEITGTWQIGLDASTPIPQKYLDVNGNPEDWLPISDVIPEELTLSTSRPVSNADVASQYDNPAEHEIKLGNWGRLSGYEHEYFSKNECTYTTGLYRVYVETILMKDEWGAEQYMNWLEEDDKGRETAKNYEVVNGLGDAAYAIWYEGNDNCNPPNITTQVTINFRRYNVIGLIIVDAISGTMDYDNIREFALKIAYITDSNLMVAAK